MSTNQVQQLQQQNSQNKTLAHLKLTMLALALTAALPACSHWSKTTDRLIDADPPRLNTIRTQSILRQEEAKNAALAKVAAMKPTQAFYILDTTQVTSNSQPTAYVLPNVNPVQTGQTNAYVNVSPTPLQVALPNNHEQVAKALSQKQYPEIGAQTVPLQYSQYPVTQQNYTLSPTGNYVPVLVNPTPAVVPASGSSNPTSSTSSPVIISNPVNTTPTIIEAPVTTIRSEPAPYTSPIIEVVPPSVAK